MTTHNLKKCVISYSFRICFVCLYFVFICIYFSLPVSRQKIYMRKRKQHRENTVTCQCMCWVHATISKVRNKGSSTVEIIKTSNHAILALSKIVHSSFSHFLPILLNADSI